MSPASSPAHASRRHFVQYLSGIAGLTAIGSLSGCAGADTSASPSPTGASRGGRLRIGALGAAGATLAPADVQGNADYLAVLHVFDSLTLLRGGQIELSLAESIEPSSDATTWTLRLRPGVTFHDGSPVRAADAAYSLRVLTASPFFGQFLADIDAEYLRVRDERTLELPLRRPRADLVEGALGIGITVFPEDTTDFAQAIGSGPFRLSSFRPGSATVLQRNPDYWAGAPLLDEVEILTVPDAAARLNGVRSGELDLAMRVTAAGAAAQEGEDVRIIRGDAGDADVLGFVMNVTQAPFNDPAVRLACKLACDRQGIVDAVLLGEGDVGNDLIGMGLPGYDDAIPQREYDPDEARRLFATAGVTEIPLKVADLTPGIVAAGEVYAEQLGRVGVQVRLEQADPASYFNDYAALLATPYLSPHRHEPARVPGPLATSAAWQQLEGWLDAPWAWVPGPSPRYRQILGRLLQAHAVQGPLVTDAQLAARDRPRPPGGLDRRGLRPLRGVALDQPARLSAGWWIDTSPARGHRRPRGSWATSRRCTGPVR